MIIKDAYSKISQAFQKSLYKVQMEKSIHIYKLLCTFLNYYMQNFRESKTFLNVENVYYLKMLIYFKM